MIRPSARLLAAPLAIAASCAAPLAAQEQPQTFSLPTATPTPAPAPAGPADERAGVAIPPRVLPSDTPAVQPSVAPTAAPLPAPTSAPIRVPTPAPRPLPGATLPAPVRTAPAPLPQASATAAPTETPGAVSDPWAPPPAPPLPDAVPDAAITEIGGSDNAATLPAWWPYVAGGLGALALLGGGAWLWARRKPKTMRLAAPAITVPRGGGDDAAPDPADLHLTLEITSATRSLMMFTLGYRLTIANRSQRAVNDLASAVQIACARASGGNGPSAGAAQALGTLARIGPGQSRSITGEVQLPLAAIQPLRQGSVPMFVPLVHVTLDSDKDGGGQPVITRSFVVGPRSASGRIHPIQLDQPPGGIAGLVAQSIAIPPASAAA